MVTVCGMPCFYRDLIGRRGHNDCMDGDVFIVQRVVGQEEAVTLQRPNVAAYLNYQRNRYSVRADVLEVLLSRTPQCGRHSPLLQVPLCGSA